MQIDFTCFGFTTTALNPGRVIFLGIGCWTPSVALEIPSPDIVLDYKLHINQCDFIMVIIFQLTVMDNLKTIVC